MSLSWTLKMPGFHVSFVHVYIRLALNIWTHSASAPTLGRPKADPGGRKKGGGGGPKPPGAVAPGGRPPSPVLPNDSLGELERRHNGLAL